MTQLDPFSSTTAATGTALLSLILLGICWQDVRERQVSLLLLLLLLLGCSLRFFLLGESVQYLLFNSLFLLLQGTAVLLYLLLRYRSIRLTNYLGAGDLLFWLACLWCFSPLNFTFFFVLSLIGALILHLTMRLLAKTHYHTSIPLAGYQGLFLILAFVLDATLPGWNAFDDFTILNRLGL